MSKNQGFFKSYEFKAVVFKVDNIVYEFDNTTMVWKLLANPDGEEKQEQD